MLTVTTPADLIDHVGEDLGESRWLAVDQARIDMFAEATDDRQWIHVDPEAAAAGPFGGTIAHGFLTLSLLTSLLDDLLRIEDAGMLINYGLDRVRFPSPVPAGAEVRARGRVMSAEHVTGGVQVVLAIEVGIRDAAKPACVVEWVLRAYGK